MQYSFLNEAGSIGTKRYAEHLLRENIGKKVIVVLNFAGQFPPEKRTFEGEIEAVGNDFFIIITEQARTYLMAYFVNLATLSFLEKPNLPADLLADHGHSTTPTTPTTPSNPSLFPTSPPTTPIVPPTTTPPASATPPPSTPTTPSIPTQQTKREPWWSVKPQPGSPPATMPWWEYPSTKSMPSIAWDSHAPYIPPSVPWYGVFQAPYTPPSIPWQGVLRHPNNTPDNIPWQEVLQHPPNTPPNIPWKEVITSNQHKKRRPKQEKKDDTLQ